MEKGTGARSILGMDCMLHAHVDPKERPKYNHLNMVFCDCAGEPYKPNFITDSFKRDTKSANLPKIRFHDLCHGHATMLLELGVDLKVISDRLGHSTITLTANTYSHVREKRQREALINLSRRLILMVKELWHACLYLVMLLY